jgi:hypothetical protein
MKSPLRRLLRRFQFNGGKGVDFAEDDAAGAAKFK